jgi:hypothetical protein
VQRRVYREFVGRTCQMIHAIDPDCLVTFNWAYSLRMPEKPDPGIAYLTGDIANRVEGLSAEAHWYDGVGLPFDLMTTGYTFVDDDGRPHRRPKPVPQIQQEMAIVIANGGRFNLWDNPSPTSAIDPNLHRFYGRVVGPFLRSRQPWCLGSQRVPDVSLLHSSAAHYALADRTANSFNRADPPIDVAADLLARLHLNYEMVGDWRLRTQDINSGLLIIEHPAALDERDVTAMIRYVESGGHLLLTRMGMHHDERLKALFGLAPLGEPAEPEKLTCTIRDRRFSFRQSPVAVRPVAAKIRLHATDSEGARRPLLTINRRGRGLAYYVSVPMFSGFDKHALPFDLVREIMSVVWPAERRQVTTEAPAHVEIVLRRKGNCHILHLVNLAPGERTYASQRGWYRPVTIRSLPQVGPHKTTIRLPRRPKSVILQPEGVALTDWTYRKGRVELRVPAFDVHRMIVVELEM